MSEVSVIVPVYNSAAWLAECVESVLSQTLADWELLLVDDGSTDASNRICMEYAETDRRIKVISKPNGGVSTARNVGLDFATGRYVTFLDSDDVLLPDALSLLLDLAEREGVEIVIGRSVSAPALADVRLPVKAPGVRIVDSVAHCRDVFYRRTPDDTSVCGRIYARSLFDGRRFYRGRYEDLELFHKLLMATDRVAVTDAVVYFYRENPGSFIHTWSDGRRDAVKVTAGIAECYAGFAPLQRAALHRHFRANYNLILELLRHSPSDRDSIVDCYAVVKALRRGVLSDKAAPVKSRLGALLSYLGLRGIRLMRGK